MTSNISKIESDNIVQALGLRLIDWRRMTDKEASTAMTDLVARIGGDCFTAAIKRIRELDVKPRMIKLAAICSLGIPEVPNLVKNPPDWDDDELWRYTFRALVADEQRRQEMAYRRKLVDDAMATQL